MTPSLFDGTSGWPVSTVSVGMTSTILAATEPYEDDHDSLITFGMSSSFSCFIFTLFLRFCFVCKIDT